MDEEYNVPPKDIEPMFHQKTLSNVPPEDIEEGITIHSSKVKESFAYGALLEHQKVDELWECGQKCAFLCYIMSYCISSAVV